MTRMKLCTHSIYLSLHILLNRIFGIPEKSSISSTFVNAACLPTSSTCPKQHKIQFIYLPCKQ
eukprot:m.71514 g.71514  ORF g.71514 m.71514 type:complete len:63 (+) comp8352_c0_seq2:255-443(+)